MCGITGFCDTLGPSQDAAERRVAVLRHMMDRLRHRGPDGDGTYVDTHACLGHLRLKIIDLSDQAQQPMSTADGSLVICFNGEIYNYRAIKRALTDRYDFRSTSDTEVLLYGFREWGDEILTRANGMFAIAIWDAPARSLLLARDRLGKKPLFYFWDGRGQVAFASELKALLKHPGVDAWLDEQSLASFFTFGYVPTPGTIFKNIYKVPQGATVCFRNGERTVARYWDLPEDEQPRSETEALEELDALLQDAVRIRLESDVPLGFFLSGGIDSSLVTAIGQKLTGNACTFTAGFSNPAYDEAPYARAIAAHLGTRHTELRLNENHFSSFLDHAPEYFDEPFADSSLIATYHLSRVTREHVTVALSGDGGDELFCGYQKYLNLTQLQHAMKLPDALRAGLAQALETIPTNTTRKAGHALHAGSTTELVRWLVSIWKQDELAQLMPHAVPDWDNTQHALTWQRFAHRDDLSRLMAADVKSYLCDDILQKVDRASMAVSLEVRSPLLDYRIVEFAMRLPLALKFRDGQQKYLLRKLLARYLPERLWMRRKQGFNVPVQAWYRGERRPRLEGAIRELGARFAGVLSPAAMGHFLQQHLTGKYDYSQKLFALDMLSGWTREYQPE